MTLSLTVIIPTKNRARMIQALLESMRNLAGLDQIRPQIIVADNNSEDGTWEVLQEITSDFPVPITVIKVYTPGKSAVINEAVRLAKGSMIAFLDDDVTTDRGWLQAVERFASQGGFQVGQGRIQLQSPDADDPEVQRLIQRFRTIPKLDFDHTVQRVHSLNGANFTAMRKALDRVGLFNERLGPGASGTSEDVELAQRFARVGIGIGYMPPLWDASIVDEIVAVTTNDAKDMARRIAREEGLFAGTSSGANVTAAIRVGQRLGPKAKIVTLMVDSGLKYLNTDVYKRG